MLNAAPIRGLRATPMECILDMGRVCPKNKTPDLLVFAAGVNVLWHSDPTVKIGGSQPSSGMGVDLDDDKTYVIVDLCATAGGRVMLTAITPIKIAPEFKRKVTARGHNAFFYAN